MRIWTTIICRNGSAIHQAPASADDAHRPRGKQHGLEAILCRGERRAVANDYTFRVGGQMYQIEREHVRPRLGGASIRVEQRRNGEIAVRLEGKYLPVRLCDCTPAKPDKPSLHKPAKAPKPNGKSRWMEGFFDRSAPNIEHAIAIANATS